MTPEIHDFVRGLKLRGKTLEVGSLDVNGSVRELFRDYIGVDMRPGKNVDKVANCHTLPFKSSSFQNVLSLDMLEHDEEFWLSVAEMRRVLRKGGRMVITVPGLGFPKHDHPFDFYRFTVEAVELMFKGFRKVEVRAVGDYAWSPIGLITVNGFAAVHAHGVKS